MSAMPTTALITSASAAAYFALALVMALRGRSRPMAVQVGVMAGLLSAYSLLDVMGTLANDRRYDHAAYGMAALLAIPTLDLVVTFIGRRRDLRRLRWLVGGCFVLLAAASMAPIVRADLRWLHGHGTWALAMTVVAVPTFSYVGWLALGHGRQAEGQERARAWLVLSLLLLGVGSSLVDVALIAADSGLRLSELPLLLCSLLLAALALRVRLLRNVTALSGATVATLALMAALLQVTAFVWLGTRIGLLVVVTVVVIVTLTAAVRPVLSQLATERERTRSLATVGRWSTQMAHDLKNPIAAIRGAAQFLQEEMVQGRSLEPHDELLTVIVDQTDRLTRVIEDYQRLGRVEPALAEFDLCRLVRHTIEAQERAEGIDVALELGTASMLCLGDADLIGAAIENIFRNACEAGSERVRVGLARGDGVFCITVEDDGPGMDPRTRERALDDFFTTKASGSGLGLAYAARVARAHGGRIELSGRPAGGTCVQLELGAPPQS
jgi:two-component system, NtrC family, sensor histidine kinase HydH